MYGPEINTPGNVVIAGQDSNNGLFFSKIQDLKIGDKIYITDIYGNRVEYYIYNKNNVEEGNYSYMENNANGNIEVTLYTVNSDGQGRIVVHARAD